MADSSLATAATSTTGGTLFHDLRDRPCPLCGGSGPVRSFAPECLDARRLSKDAFASRKLPDRMHWRIDHCLGCDLLYSARVPRDSAIADEYRVATFPAKPESRHAAETYAALLRNDLPASVGRGALLDIGTGDGMFLAAARSLGFAEVAGVEPAEAAIAQAPDDLRPKIVHGLFGDGLFEASTFDVVTCFQTIEHVPDPLGLCREAFRILRPGGALVLVGHDFRALSARLLGTSSPIFDIEHLQLFNRASFGRLLREAGFAEAVVRPIWNRYPASHWVRLFPVPGFAGRLKPALVAASGWLPGRIPLPAGNLLAIGVKPASSEAALASRGES